MTKKCNKCRQEKDLFEGFSVDKSSKDGRKNICRTCRNETTREWKQTSNGREKVKINNSEWKKDNPDKVRSSKKRYREENPEIVKEGQRRCWENNREKYMATLWRRHLQTKYGLTEDKYYELLQEQNYVCAICGAAEADSKRKKFCVDHCHDTGVVRGLLCFGCNTMLGNAQDDPEILQNAIDYLKKFPKTVAPVVESKSKEETCDPALKPIS